MSEANVHQIASRFQRRFRELLERGVWASDDRRRACWRATRRRTARRRRRPAPFLDRCRARSRAARGADRRVPGPPPRARSTPPSFRESPRRRGPRACSALSPERAGCGRRCCRGCGRRPGCGAASSWPSWRRGWARSPSRRRSPLLPRDGAGAGFQRPGYRTPCSRRSADRRLEPRGAAPGGRAARAGGPARRRPGARLRAHHAAGDRSGRPAAERRRGGVGGRLGRGGSALPRRSLGPAVPLRSMRGANGRRTPRPAELERADWIWNGETLPVPVEDIADSCFGLHVREVEDLRTAPGVPDLEETRGSPACCCPRSARSG